MSRFLRYTDTEPNRSISVSSHFQTRCNACNVAFTVNTFWNSKMLSELIDYGTSLS